MSIEESWGSLGPFFQAAVGQAVASLSARGLPVGAVISTGGRLASAGRNRVFDPPGGSDILQETPLAHAELNALAALKSGVEPEDCELWTTHSPCSMCAAAIQFIGIGAVHFLAPDPSDSAAVDSHSGHQLWAVAANVLFLHNIAWVGGTDNPILLSGREPEATALALSLAENHVLIERLPLLDPVALLAPHWTDIVDAAAKRVNRTAG